MNLELCFILLQVALMVVDTYVLKSIDFFFKIHPTSAMLFQEISLSSSSLVEEYPISQLTPLCFVPLAIPIHCQI